MRTKLETKKKKIDTLTMVELALILAITIIMGTTPLGTIRTPFLSISFIIALVGVQGLIEAVSCCVLAGAVSWALQKAIKR